MSQEAVWCSLTEQVRQIQGGHLTAQELAERYLDRIAALDDRLKSYVCINESALAQAKAIDARVSRGEDCGPLAGACVAIKDNYLTADMPTRVGTQVEALRFPQADSYVVSRLRQAGAVILGKTRMHEFAWGAVTPPARNPWNTDYVPGGSSGGSGAAVAAALCSAATGSDTGGSIRMPANLCGTVGIKPTFGLVSRAGVVPHSWSLDHAGPLTRSVADAARVLQVLCGPDLEDPVASGRTDDYVAACGKPVRDLRIAVITNHFTEGVTEDVERAFQHALDWGRTECRSVREYQVPSLQYGLAAIFAIELASASAYHDRAVQEGLTAGYTEDVRDLIDMGRFVTGVDYLHAEQIRTLMCREMAAIFQDNDLILTPTMPLSAWRVGQDSVQIRGEARDVLESSWQFTYPFNLTGLPAMTVPVGFSRDGMPMGLQIVGKPFSEAALFTFASAFESDHAFDGKRPAQFA